MKPATIAVHGSYFHENFGDIVLVSMYRKWVKRHSSSRVVLPMASARAMELIGGDARGLRAMRDASGLVLTGGGYFGEPPHQEAFWRYRSMARHGPPTLLARQKGIPHAVIGVGAGPITNPTMRKMVVRICQEAEIVAVRDIESANYLREYGVGPQKVEVTADAALTIERSDVPQASVESAREFLKASTGDVRVGIHLDLAKGVKHREALLAQELRRLQEASPNTDLVCFFDAKSIIRRTDDPGSYFHAIAAEIPRKPIFVPYTDPWRLAAILGELDAVFTTKLHVGIVATALGCDVVSMPAHPKTYRFYRQTGQADRCLDPADLQEGVLSSLMQRVIDGSLGRDAAPLQEAIRAARRNETLVAEFLQRRG